MRTQGEIEAAISVAIARFEKDYMGRGPKDIRAHLITDLLVIRLHGVLTAAEQQLVNSLPADKGRELLKQVRSRLMEAARPTLEAMVQEVTGAKVLSLHHDIKGKRKVDIHQITCVLAEDNKWISSTRIYRGEIDEHGRLLQRK